MCWWQRICISFADLTAGDDDAADSRCQIKTVSNILAGNILDHLGPYEGVPIGTIFCT
jgi:hypothetical protein